MEQSKNHLAQVAVKVIICNSKNEILLLKKQEWDLALNTKNWDIPGGRIEMNETIADCLDRELKEEIGLDIPGIASQTSFFTTAEILRTDFHLVFLVYLLHMDISDITLSKEHSSYIWKNINEINEVADEQSALGKVLCSQELNNALNS